MRGVTVCGAPFKEPLWEDKSTALSVLSFEKTNPVFVWL